MVVALRLAGGTSPFNGLLEVFHNGSWGHVCDDGWSFANSAVACRQLGMGSVGAAIDDNMYYWTFPEDNVFDTDWHDETIVMDNVRCLGTERRLSECAFASSTWST